MKEHLFDKRVVTRALQEGLLDKEVYQRMIDELPDLSHKVQTAAESQALEAASQASASSGLGHGVHAALPSDATDDSFDGEDDDLDDEDDEPGENPPQTAAHPVSDTLEMERPRIPGSYNPDY